MYNRTILLLSATVILLAVVLESCKHDSFVVPEPYVPGECYPDSIYFEKDVMPILQVSCITGCHDEVSAEDGVVLTSYSRIMSTAKVRVGNAGESELYEVLVDSDPNDRMPYNQPALPQEQIDIIRKWINQGAKNSTCDFDTVEASCGEGTISFANDVTPVFQSNGCTGCHSGGNIILNTYEGAKTVAENGRLVGSINHDPNYQAMPQGGGKIDTCDIRVIEAWIAQGINNN